MNNDHGPKPSPGRRLREAWAKVPAESRKLGLGIRRLVSSRIGVLGEIIRAPSDRHMPLGRDHDLDLRFAAVIGKVAG